ncbi:PTS ascorbate transporter subunit IIC [Marinactinospora rubrisoli]|uniref:Ascorbate-specific PTS system EIIC component n=1 Tax=Marinactinospora rubrisoli TaxID=2715399 RepID=A0ABW2KI40_9ACTN
MERILTVMEFVVDEVLTVPAYLVGLITAVGLIALRRPLSQIVGGGVKAALGFLLIEVGAMLVTMSLKPLGTMIRSVTGAHGVIPNNEAIVALVQAELGPRVPWVMFGGFVLSLLLARFTPLRYVFLTGHHILWMSTLVTLVLAAARLPPVVTVLLGAVLLAVMFVSMPALAQPWTRRVGGDGKIAIGHFGSLGYITAGLVGQLVGRRGRGTEDVQVPEGLRFLRDPMVSTGLSMGLIYPLVAVAYLWKEGSATARRMFPPLHGAEPTVGHYFMQSVMQGLLFGVSVAVILYGVRTILGELIPAFQGIANRIVPGAVPALDAPIVFPFGQNAVLVGFLASMTGALVSLAVVVAVLDPAAGIAVVLPGLLPQFFTGGAAGVYGNATGGRRGAVCGGFVNGVLITFLPAVLLGVLGRYGTANTTFGDTDFGWYGILIGYAARPGGVLGAVLALLAGALVFTLAVIVQKRLVETGWDPGARRDAELARLEAEHTRRTGRPETGEGGSDRTSS